MSSVKITRRDFAFLFAAVSSRLKHAWSMTGSTDSGSTPELRPAGNDSVEGANAFPLSDYAPFGYLDNPGHSAVLNRSGIVRSVPPLGFGWWARRLPWPYGEGALRRVNYLSFLHLSVVIDGEVRLHLTEDFAARKIELVSRYHTGNLFSYDWSYGDLGARIEYCLSTPDSLLAKVDIRNHGGQPHTVTIHATNIYGFPEERWWGCDGVTSSISPHPRAAVAKIWAYGDIFALGADRPSDAGKATSAEDKWDGWISRNDLSSNSGESSQFPGAMYTVQSYNIALNAGKRDELTICLARGVNQRAATTLLRSAVDAAPGSIRKKVEKDDGFYRSAPRLTGDWPAEWTHGWIYDLETLRMTMRPPLGIYKHPWDGMQIFTPRAVLGETMLDSMALSYGDSSLAKDVVLGMFADAPAPNLPCSREDGSVNMICADGSEAGTAPTWGMPFHVIRSIYLRTQDDKWITALYPYMKRYLNWWLANRTDGNGWFHCKCSWESGQDASKRFLVAAENPGAVSDFVRTVDVEAAMADGFSNMALFCETAGHPEDGNRWRELARHRIETTRAMFVDGWFRDFDSRDNKPIILKDYYDIMMLYPLALGITTEEQTRALTPWLKYFAEHALYWLEWPSFMFPYCEAAWNAGQRLALGNIVAGTASRVYKRTDSRRIRGIAGAETTLPAQYQYRMPGVGTEFWPIEEDNPGGCENYGWGATLPMLLIRNVIGFREFDDSAKNAFRLAPALPENLLTPKSVYGMTNLNFRSTVTNVEYQVVSGSSLKVKLTVSGKARQVSVKDASGKTLAQGETSGEGARMEFAGVNGEVYTVEILA